MVVGANSCRRGIATLRWRTFIVAQCRSPGALRPCSGSHERKAAPPPQSPRLLFKPSSPTVGYVNRDPSVEALRPHNFDCFLSHDHRDQRWAHHLSAELKRRGVRVWIDTEKIREGNHLTRSIHEGLADSRHVLLILTENYFSNDRPWLQVELYGGYNDDLQGERRRLLPILRRDCRIPRELQFLRNIRNYDFRSEATLQNDIDRLAAFLKSTRNQILTTKLPNRYRPEAIRLQEIVTEKLRLESEGMSTAHLLPTLLRAKRAMRLGLGLEPGDCLSDRYLLEREIGRGGFATVWLAYDHVAGKYVACKVLHGFLSSDSSVVDRFYRGARHMASIRHPHVVSVLEPELEDEQRRFFVMEYVHRGNLDALLRIGPWRRDDLLDVFEAIASALETLHATGVAHRDIKPSNILVDAGGVPKLSDFDLVQGVDTTGMTREGAMLGTYYFASPEMLTDASVSGRPADVYSLSMTTAVALRRRGLPRVDMKWRVDDLLEDVDATREIKDILRGGLSLEPGERPNIKGWLAAIRVARGRSIDTAAPPWVPRVLHTAEARSGPHDDLTTISASPARGPQHDQRVLIGSRELPSMIAQTADGSLVLQADIGIRLASKHILTLLRRGSRLPTRVDVSLSTANSGQTDACIGVMTGFGARPEHNIEVHDFSVVGIPPAPRGVPVIDVRFAVDETGLFVVSANDRHSTKRVSWTLQKESWPPATRYQQVALAFEGSLLARDVSISAEEYVLGPASRLDVESGALLGLPPGIFSPPGFLPRKPHLDYLNETLARHAFGEKVLVRDEPEEPKNSILSRIVGLFRRK